MAEPRHEPHRAVGEVDPNVQHLRPEVAIGVAPASHGAAAGGEDSDRGSADVRLQLDRGRDAPSEQRGGPIGDGSAEVLVEDPAELHPGLEGQRLAPRDLRPVDGG